MKAFAFIAPALPSALAHPIAYIKGRRFYASLPGMLDYHYDTQRDWLVLIFATVPHAQKARDALLSTGNWAGKYIFNTEYDPGDRRAIVGEMVDKKGDDERYAGKMDS